MKTTLNLETVEEKKTKTGRSYVRVNGKINCFDAKMCEKLLANIGKDVSLELEESNGYNNIKAFYGDGVKSEVVKDTIKEGYPMEGARNNTNLMAAKDIFCVLYNAMVVKSDEEGIPKETGIGIMDIAISLVKQARDGLK